MTASHSAILAARPWLAPRQKNKTVNDGWIRGFIDVFSPAMPLGAAIPIRSGHSVLTERRESALRMGFGSGYGSESMIPALASGPLTLRNQSTPGHHSHLLGTSS